MKRSVTATAVGAVTMVLAAVTSAAAPAEPLLKKLPPGVFVKSSVLVPPQQAKEIAQKLGGEIERLSNSVVQVHGRAIQVNVIAAANDASARAIHQSLSKIKVYPFCLRNELLVVEYVGKDIDDALATKTSYELGLVPKPATTRYRVTAELAAVDRADYMSCNPLFNQFLALRGDPATAQSQIAELTKKFAFGRQLVLRNPALCNVPATYQFQPAVGEAKELGCRVQYSFDKLPRREGVPFVTATMEITAHDTGLTPIKNVPDKALTAATKFWPSDDPQFVALAKQITAGMRTNADKANAILQWLQPGKNLKYDGQTGSRWGTAKVLNQKFGHCWDFSDLFVTLCRAAGVPSRQVAGWLYGSSGHVWAEFFSDGADQSWQQVDPTGGGLLRCGIYHIPYFTTDDGEMPIVYVSLPIIKPVKPK